MERKPEVPASPRGEALFRCARPSGVPRGPATSTGSLVSQKHPRKFPKVPGTHEQLERQAEFHSSTQDEA